MSPGAADGRARAGPERDPGAASNALQTRRFGLSCASKVNRMFTAMIRRPLVWLLGILALLGAGWLFYEPGRDSPQPIAESADPPEALDSAAAPLERTAPEAGAIAPPAAEPAPQTAGLEQDSTRPSVDARAAPEAAPGAVARATPAPDELAAGPEQAGGVGDAATAPEVVEPGPAAGDETRERVPAPARMLDTIRRALAALLGGPPAATDPSAQSAARVEEPPAPVAAARPSSSEEPGAGAPEPVRPSFDIVRVERDGRTVVAGRAAPGAEIELRAGNRVIDRVRANDRGEWVATPLEPLAPGGQELSVAARSAGAPAIEAEQVVVVVVPGLPQPQSAAVALAAPPAEPFAVLLPKQGAGAGRILQAPGRISSDGKLALVVLDYDESGRTRLTGEAPPGVPVRIYVDDQPSAQVLTEASGRWTAVLDQQLAPGDYTLRLDQLGGEGHPVARLETPFTRVSQPPVAGEAQVDYVIVQPGNSLWRIARRLFGNGFKYVHIYDANQAQIRNPDLIYPGQVFEIPAATGTAG
jgi:nucleoid-associated protein YgaU